MGKKRCNIKTVTRTVKKRSKKGKEMHRQDLKEMNNRNETDDVC